jgi:hypothetical protein
MNRTSRLLGNARLRLRNQARRRQTADRIAQSNQANTKYRDGFIAAAIEIKRTVTGRLPLVYSWNPKPLFPWRGNLLAWAAMKRHNAWQQVTLRPVDLAAHTDRVPLLRSKQHYEITNQCTEAREARLVVIYAAIRSAHCNRRSDTANPSAHSVIGTLF